MKTLVFLLLSSVFIGCASTQSTSIAPDSMTEGESTESEPEKTAPEETVDSQLEAEAEEPSERKGTLLERYISGDLPGYER